MPFSGAKRLICHEHIFFGTNHYYYFHLPIGPFHCKKFLKNLIFGPKMVDLPQCLFGELLI